MTYRSSFSSAYGAGRTSPYAHRLSAQDRTFSDLFEYVDAGETGSRTQTTNSAPFLVEEDDAPDVIHVKYMGFQYKVDFPPYSISESGVTVQEVRRRVADLLQQDPRRVRLVYKDRELRYDPNPVKKYGCKQNSELAAVVTEQSYDYGGTDNHQSSGDDSGSGSSLRPPTEGRRPRGLSTVRYRAEEVRKPSSSSTFLHPNGHASEESRKERRRSKSPGVTNESYGRSSEKFSSASQPSTPVVSRSPRSAPADPSSPLGKVQALQNQYYDKWLPEAQQFLRSPPTDAAQKDRDYRRISETIMRHVVEAADAIELQGDQVARAERKKVLSEAQEMLKKLDALSKSK